MKKTNQPQDSDDAALIAGMLAGAGWAFERTVALYNSRMLSIARAIIGDAFAEEIVQDAWVSAIRGLPEFAGRCSLQSWLIQISANAAKTRLRREKRHVSLDQNWQQDSADDHFNESNHWREKITEWDIDTPEAIAENSQLSQLISHAFDKLPPQQQAVLTLFDLEGESMSEICNILEITASNARVLLHRARSSIQQQIIDYQGNV